MKIFKFCGIRHQPKLVVGQKIYLTEDTYDVVCKKCGKLYDWHPMVVQDVLDLVVSNNQEVVDDRIREVVYD